MVKLWTAWPIFEFLSINVVAFWRKKRGLLIYLFLNKFIILENICNMIKILSSYGTFIFISNVLLLHYFCAVNLVFAIFHV